MGDAAPRLSHGTALFKDVCKHLFRLLAEVHPPVPAHKLGALVAADLGAEHGDMTQLLLMQKASHVRTREQHWPVSRL
jgi:hypothetical protein